MFVPLRVETKRGIQRERGPSVCLYLVVVVVVAVVVVVVVAGDRTRGVWRTGAGTSGVPAASFGGRGLTARVYRRCTEVGRAV